MDYLTPSQLEERLHALFREPLADEELRDRFTALNEPCLSYLGAVWGPPLYRRNRVMFLPIILSRFHDWDFGEPWRGKYQEALEQWLAEADRLGDVPLFQRLLRWKLTSSYWRPRRAWERELVERFRNTAKSHERAEILTKYDLGYQLSDATALALYDIDAETAREFISTRIEIHGRKGMPSELRERARQAGDEKLYHQLYRLQVTARQWRADALSLCEKVADPAELCRQLESWHPNLYGRDVGDVFLELARRRGADVLPYLQARLPGWSRDRWYAALRDLARQRGWTEFHATLIRTCGSQEEYQATVVEALADRARPDDEVINRVYLLTGIAGARFAARAFDEATALALYRRFPDLARGPFRRLIHLPYKSKDHALLREVLAANDETMIDHLASQAVTASQAGEDLPEHYAALRDRPEEFTRRAVAVLSHLPAYSIGDSGYQQLIRTNRLARLLLERSTELQLASAGLLRDMLESPGIFVQILAMRALALDDDRARNAAAENLDLLLPMLLRPLHRRTRLLALRALSNAATTEDRGRIILGRARDALELPDRHYPREQLIGLIGKILACWPNLRQARERPVVYGRTPV